MNEQSALQATARRDNSIQVSTIVPCTQLGWDCANKREQQKKKKIRHSDFTLINFQGNDVRFPSPKAHKTGTHSYR